MDDSSRAEWRVSVLGRALLGFSSAFCLLAAFGLVGLVIDKGAPAALFGVAAVAGLAVWALRTAFRPFLILTATELVIRNKTGPIHRIPLATIEHVCPGYYGMVIAEAGGVQHVAEAVQKANLSSWLGRETRADRAAQQIEQAAAEAGAQIQPQG